MNDNKKREITVDNIAYVIQKFQKYGFAGLALSDLAVAVAAPDFQQYFIRQTGQDWNQKYEIKALEALQKANFDMQWMLEKEQEELKPIFEACRKGDVSQVKEFIAKEKGFGNIRTAVNQYSRNLLHVACENGHPVLVEFLLMQGFNPNSRDKILCTPLHYACLKGYEYIADILIQYKAKIEDADSNGRTAFHYACASTSSQILHLLIGYQPKIVNVTDNNGLTGLHYTILNSSSKQIDQLRTILEQGGDVNARDVEGKTPIFYASELGKTRVIPILIQKGADISIPDYNSKKTALDIATNNRTRELLVVYTSQVNNPKPEDIDWMNTAIRGEKPKAKKSPFTPLDMDQTIVAGQSPQQGTTQPIQSQQNQQKGQPLENNFINMDKNSMHSLSRQRFFHMMKKIQEEGVKVYQHIKKPFLYTGSWMEDAWKSAIEVPLQKKIEKDKQLQMQLSKYDDVKIELELKDRMLKEKIDKNKQLMQINQELKVKIEELSGGGEIMLSPDIESQLKEQEAQIFDLKQKLQQSKKQLKIYEQQLLKDKDDEQQEGPSTQQLEQTLLKLKEDLRYEKQKNISQRFKCGQLFLKTIKDRFPTQKNNKIQMVGQQDDNLQDDKALIRMFAALKKNSNMSLEERLKKVDSNGDNRITQDEFIQFLKELKIVAIDIVSLLRVFKFQEGKKELGIKEFKEILVQRSKNREAAEERLFKKLIDTFEAKKMSIEEIFQLLDKDGNGEVDIEEFKIGLKELRININPRDLNNIFCIFDEDDGGGISLIEMKATLDEYKQRLEGKVLDESQAFSEEEETTQKVKIWIKENQQFQSEAQQSLSTVDKISGQIQITLIQLRKSLHKKGNKIWIIAQLEGCESAYNDPITPDDQGRLNCTMKFNVNQQIPSGLGDYISIQFYQNKDFTEANYVGEIFIAWKVCVLYPEEYHISEDFTLVNEQFVNKKTSGFVGVQALWNLQKGKVEADKYRQKIKKPEELNPITRDQVQNLSKNYSNLSEQRNQISRLLEENSDILDLMSQNEVAELNNQQDAYSRLDSNITNQDIVDNSRLSGLMTKSEQDRLEQEFGDADMNSDL